MGPRAWAGPVVDGAALESRTAKHVVGPLFPTSSDTSVRAGTDPSKPHIYQTSWWESTQPALKPIRDRAQNVHLS